MLYYSLPLNEVESSIYIVVIPIFRLDKLASMQLMLFTGSQIPVYCD
nr:MAG TPA: hypothetical protein [Caudoviricetes sp.]